jgi:hypothetical protein
MTLQQNMAQPNSSARASMSNSKKAPEVDWLASRHAGVLTASNVCKVGVRCGEAGPASEFLDALRGRPRIESAIGGELMSSTTSAAGNGQSSMAK